jgi:hypothetical protein
MQILMTVGIAAVVLVAVGTIPVTSAGDEPPASGVAARVGSLGVSHEEEPAVRKALGYYLEGHATGQGSAYARVFHPEAKLFFNREGKFSQVTSAEYIARASGAPPADEAQRRRRIDFIDITGDVAVAKITLEHPGVTLTDYMSLLKVDGEWRIVNKIFHANRQPTRSE